MKVITCPARHPVNNFLWLFSPYYGGYLGLCQARGQTPVAGEERRAEASRLAHARSFRRNVPLKLGWKNESCQPVSFCGEPLVIHLGQALLRLLRGQAGLRLPALQRLPR